MAEENQEQQNPKADPNGSPITDPNVVTQEQITALTNELAAQREIISAQKKELAGLKVTTEVGEKKPVEKLKAPEKVIKINGKEWKFRLAHFRLGGNYYLSEDAALDKELLKEIVAIEGQGILEQQF